MEEALYLSNIASEVTLVHRRDALRAEKMLQQHLFEKAEKGNIKIAWDSVLDEVLGDDSGVTGIRIKNVKDAGTEELAVHGVFIAIGHRPNTGIFAGQLEMENGWIKVNGGTNGNATATSREALIYLALPRGTGLSGESPQPITGRPGRPVPDRQPQQERVAPTVPPRSRTPVLDNA